MKAKQEVRLRQWAMEVKSCQESGMTVKAWCSENGVSPKNYYYHLGKVRESMLENKVVPIFRNDNSPATEKIELISNELKVTIPAEIPLDYVATIIQVMKSC